MGLRTLYVRTPTTEPKSSEEGSAVEGRLVSYRAEKESIFRLNPVSPFVFFSKLNSPAQGKGQPVCTRFHKMEQFLLDIFNARNKEILAQSTPSLVNPASFVCLPFLYSIVIF